MKMTLPQELKWVEGGLATTNGGFTSVRISLKDAIRVYLKVTLKQAVGHASVVTPQQSKDVAGTGEKAIPVQRIWANEDCVATDTLVEKTPAATYTVTNDVKTKQVIFEINPEELDVANGFDCINVTIPTSGQATDFAQAEFLVQTRYKQTTPPTALTD